MFNTLTPVQQEALVEAVDDWYYLHEYAASMRNHFPEMPEEERIGKSQQELLELLELGLVALYRGEDSKVEDEPLSADAARAAILDSIYWNWEAIPTPAVYYLATEKGEREVFAKP